MVAHLTPGDAGHQTNVAERENRIQLPGIEPGHAGWEPAILTTRQ